MKVGDRAAAETPIPTPSRPARARFCLLAGVRHARARGGESPPQRRLALEPAPASCLARPVPARLSQERTRTAGAGPCSPALARVLVLPAGSPSPLAPPPHPVPRGGSLYLRPRKSLGQPRPPRRNPRGCPRLTCGANSLTLTFMSALALPCACCSSRPPPHPLAVRDVCALRSRLSRCLLGRARLHAPRDRIGRAHCVMREHVRSTCASAVLSACMCPEERL